MDDKLGWYWGIQLCLYLYIYIFMVYIWIILGCIYTNDLSLDYGSKHWYQLCNHRASPSSIINHRKKPFIIYHFSPSFAIIYHLLHLRWWLKHLHWWLKHLHWWLFAVAHCELFKVYIYIYICINRHLLTILNHQ